VHFAPSMIKIVDETQVQFVCSSRVLKLRRAKFLEERDLAIFTEGGKQRWYEARDKVLCLNRFIARACMYTENFVRTSYRPILVGVIQLFKVPFQR
jgi:hypothetical protein